MDWKTHETNMMGLACLILCAFIRMYCRIRESIFSLLVYVVRNLLLMGSKMLVMRVGWWFYVLEAKLFKVQAKYETIQSIRRCLLIPIDIHLR